MLELNSPASLSPLDDDHAPVTREQALNDYRNTERALQESEARYRSLVENQQNIASQLRESEALRRTVEWAVGERVKELTCLLHVSHLLEQRLAPIETICTAIAAELIPAMQFPQATIPLLVLDGVNYTAGNYHEGLTHALCANIDVSGRPRGQICVYYTGDEPFIIPEEQNLLSNIARMFGLWLEQRESELAMHAAQRELEELNRDLEERVEERTAAVLHNEAVYRALFENSNDGIFLIAPSGEDLLYNQKALDMLGYTREEYAALPAAAIIQSEQRPQAYDFLAAVMRGEEVPLYERTFVGKNNKLIDVEINLSPVRDATGKVIMAQSVVRDITERKRAQEEIRANRDQLRIVNDALERASRMKDEFLASMSHELRTPLTGILGLSESLNFETYGPVNERQRKALNGIEQSGRHLLDLINDILDLSKIEAGKFDLDPAPCIASDICRATLQLVNGMAAQKRIEVSFAIGDDALIVVADARRLKQMLVNLLSNAIKFTPEGGQVGLDVHGDVAAQVVRFTVWDRGIGIQPEQLPKLFRVFTQLDSSLTRQYSGTGLGLALVQRMADLHNGRVEVESAPGMGSRFTIVLPWSPNGVDQRTEDTDADINLQPEEISPKLMARPGACVIIADDNRLACDMIADFLTLRGYRAAVVNNGYALLELAPEQHPDLMLVDIQMPGLDGLEVIRRLRAHHDPAVAATPIISITALAMTGDRERCLAAGANDYISKPIVLSKLLTHVQALVAGS